MEVTAETALAAIQVASTLAFVLIAAITLREWLASRDRSRMYLALAIGSLAFVSVLGQLGKLLGPWFTGLSSYLTALIFLGSGLALLLFRDSVIPLKPRTRRVVIGSVAAAAALEIVVLAAGTATPKPLQFLALLVFVAVWGGCVGEPSVRLWLAASRRPAVQRARMRALSLGYLAIIGVLVAAVLTAGIASAPPVKLGLALASLTIAPLLAAGFAPPGWLRRTWRETEDSKFRQATQDILLFSTNQATLGSRALNWAVRLTGADAGFFAAEGQLIALQGITADEARAIETVVAAHPAAAVLPLGGAPQRSAIVARLSKVEAAIILVGGPFTPVFGTDEEAWIQQYAALVSTGLERVRLVESLGALNTELVAANKELEAFSYTISHDLRAPLRAINGFTSILLEEHATQLSDEARGYLIRVRDNGEHMGQLVDDLLAFSRLGRQALRTQPVQTGDVVRRALGQLAPVLQGREVDLIVQPLPSCQSDPALLEQVFVNLLSNALKYSRKRTRARVEVGVLDGATGEAPVFFVKDNGAGFDMQYVDKLFGVFQRLHKSQDFEGTGVGLAIVHRIIERHGGRIWAEAAPEQGATFFFTLNKGAFEWQKQLAA